MIKREKNLLLNLERIVSTCPYKEISKTFPPKKKKKKYQKRFNVTYPSSPHTFPENIPYTVENYFSILLRLPKSLPDFHLVTPLSGKMEIKVEWNNIFIKFQRKKSSSTKHICFFLLNLNHRKITKQ